MCGMLIATRVPAGDAALAGDLEGGMSTFRIALLHVSPTLADVAANQQFVESALRIAAGAGASSVITPELVTTGYSFAARIGT
jgi:hypothetical protein